jgi:AraC family transcriptional regulator, regulatory protein of adaptative response / DNA-3-methyladenine glycosylase II
MQAFSVPLMLDPNLCYQAMQTKDARLDGQFFVAVRTTKIYCRPICPAVTPKRENCTFFLSAAAAQKAGFRPCLRCRPELAPHLFAHVGTAATVTRGLKLIAEGALDAGTVGELATRLGMSDRHLRQLFNKHLGTSPIAVAQTRRLHFAKQLIDETPLPMTDIALAAGFSSVRRFNDAVSRLYQRSPTELRRHRLTCSSSDTPSFSLKLPYSPPYHWAAMMRFLGDRAVAGLEAVKNNRYQRAISLNGQQGTVEVQFVPNQPYLLAQVHFPNVAQLAPIIERLRRLFDLTANVAQIAAHFQHDPILAAWVAKLPGLRVAGAWDAFEQAIRTILGQQISVVAARTLTERLVQAYGEPLSTHLKHTGQQPWRTFPTPERLATADLTSLGITKPRAQAIAHLAVAVIQTPHILTHFTTLDEAIQTLCTLPGIGEWTAQYIALRSLHEPDAFPASDLGLLRAMKALGHPVSKTELLDWSHTWQPWRAYAATYLWNLDKSYDSTVN